MKNATAVRTKNKQNKVDSNYIIREASRLLQQGRIEQAENMITTHGLGNTDDPQVLYFLGCLNFCTEHFTDSLNYFEAAITKSPHNPFYYNNRGVVLERLARNEEAAASYKKAIELKEDYAEALSNLGVLLEENGMGKDAIQYLQKAIELNAKSAKVYNSLGIAYEGAKRIAEAMQCYTKGLEIIPNDCTILNNIGHSYLLQGRADEALKAYLLAEENNSEGLSAIRSNLLLCLNYLPLDPKDVFLDHVKYGRNFLDKGANEFSNDPFPQRRLKIGYVSPDFYSHSVMYFFESVLENHNSENCEVFLYNARKNYADDTTRRLQRLADGWRDISRLSDEEAKELIQQDKIDILVDLTGHCAKNRLSLFALKPAPIQVTWIGYPNTTGLKQIDYRFTDNYADPRGKTEELHTEQLVRLPQTFLCYRPRTDISDVKDRSKQSQEGIVFASFNALAKITPPLIRLWSAILKRVLSAKLLIKTRGAGEQSVQQYLLQQFRENGITGERILFADRCANIQEHFDYYNNVDIALDTFPYHGTTTTCDALWMGVPVVCLAGKSHVSRVGVSLLNNIGLPELVADTEETYINIAVELANNTGKLIQLQAGLRKRMQESPLLDGIGMAKNVEKQYRIMWEKWVAGSKNTGKREVDQSVISEKENRLIVQGNRYVVSGQLQKAVENYKRVIKINPSNVEAYYRLAILYKENRQWKESISAYDEVVRLSPEHPEAHASFGAVLQMDGQLERARIHYEKAVHLNPYNYALLHNYAICVKEMGNVNYALELLIRAVKLKPDYLSALYQLLEIYKTKNEWEQIVAVCERILSVDPRHAEALKVAGIVLKGKGHRIKAEEYLTRALEVQPEAVDTLNTLGNLYTESGRISEAIAVYKKALAIAPNEAITYCNLAGNLAKQGKAEETLAYFRKALQLNPKLSKLHSNILLALGYLDNMSPEAIYEEHKIWAAQHAAQLYPAKEIKRNNRQEQDRRLKIGYLSPDFRNHSVAFFIEPVIKEYNSNRFEIFLYSDVKFPDDTTRRLMNYTEKWRDISRLSDDEVYHLIVNDEIDILVDLAGHTADNRMPVFARKPAPVQITWIGYPNTTGLTSMDYRFTDNFADPVGMTERYHSEKLIRLRDSFLCYSPKAGSPEVKELPYMRNGFITFGSFNNFNKVSTKVAELWAKILQKVPDSRLLLKSGGLADGYVQERTLAMFRKWGIAETRITLSSQVPSYNGHLEKYNDVDIALDTFPYHGTTTTCESLWMGVPVVTLAGNTHVARVGVSLLSNVGLPEFVAVSPEEYIQIAVNMASDIELLQEIRKNLRSQMVESPLMQVEPFTVNLEKIYHKLWRRYQYTAEINLNKGKLEIDQLLSEAQAQSAVGNVNEAKVLYEKILSIDDCHEVALHGLGLSLGYMGQWEKSIDCLERSVTLSPQYFEALYNLALLYVKKNEIQRAIELFERAYHLKPQHLGVKVNLARAYKEIGQAELSLKFYEQALNQSPENVDIIVEAGNLLGQCGKCSHAMYLLNKGLALYEGQADLLQSLGFAYKVTGESSTALKYYREAVEKNPDLSSAYSNVLSTLNCIPGYDKENVFREHRDWASRYADHFVKNFSYKAEKYVDRPLRIGYVSADFREHSVAYFLETVLKNHNSAQYTVFLYNNSTTFDDISRRFKDMVFKWVDIYGMNDDEAAERIYHDGIDILVDLSGHTAGNRLLLFARKPAPIQVTWLGYPNTTGLRTMDYRITDNYADPVSEGDDFYTEKLIRMPHCFLCYTPKVAPPREESVPCLRNNGTITFGSFNNLNKITPQVISLWAQILKAVPNSRLLLKASGLADQDRQAVIRQKFMNEGVSNEQIFLLGYKATHVEHMETYNLVDIALDTFPYNGTTTTCEALWMGVPVITVEGDRHASRVGVSLLTNAGLAELVVKDEQEYRNKAVTLAVDLNQLKTLRRQVRMNMEKSLLTDGLLFTRSLEEKYYTIWK